MKDIDHTTALGRAPLNPQPVPRGRPNCGLVALAHFTDENYDRVERFVRKLRPGNWKGVTFRKDYLAFFARIGLPVVYQQYDRREQQLTLAQWVEQVAAPGRRYFVVTTGHAQVVYDGYVIDQHDHAPVHVSQFHWKRKKVKHWFYIDGEVAQ
jgi:hypothetical protein